MDAVEKSSVLVPEGDILASNIAGLKNSLLLMLSENVSEIVIDLQKVELIDSSGIGLICATHNQIEKHNGHIKLINASDEILKMFKYMRLDQHFDIAGKST